MIACSIIQCIIFVMHFITVLQEKLRQEQLSKLKADEDAKVRLSDCTKHYESQIRTMRINHEQVHGLFSHISLIQGPQNAYFYLPQVSPA